ncbi:hypothetical protein LzC2_39700 [Planctomycetes bacterium LzC2]|uniref:Uncharacterized protein n=2 Tax=Alienimonas chondri TaxID=2681879 RepID=A0ABX1VKA6_9PLAN|nr:hypothetical protein [Alienimonas chondri]
MIAAGVALVALLLLWRFLGPPSVPEVRALWGLSWIALPVWVAAALLYTADRFFLRRSPERRLGRVDAAKWGTGLCVVGGMGGLLANGLAAFLINHFFYGPVPPLISPPFWALLWTSLLTTAGTTHGAAAWVAWAALRRGADPVRAAWVAVGTAALWVAAIIAWIAISEWVW